MWWGCVVCARPFHHFLRNYDPTTPDKTRLVQHCLTPAFVLLTCSPPRAPAYSTPDDLPPMTHSNSQSLLSNRTCTPKSPGSVYDGASTLRSPSPTGSLAPTQYEEELLEEEAINTRRIKVLQLEMFHFEPSSLPFPNCESHHFAQPTSTSHIHPSRSHPFTCLSNSI